MARVWSSGLELNTTASGVEFTGTFGAGTSTIDPNLVRSGAYSFKGTTSAAQSGVGFYHQPVSSATNVNYYIRMYFYFTALPGAEKKILAVYNSGTNAAWIALATDGTLKLFRAGPTQIGSASGALNTNTWYLIELRVDQSGGSTNTVLDGRINGSSFASGSGNTFNSVNQVIFGAGGNNGTTTWYIDDVAINDTTGSFQNTWPGEGKILHLKPNAAGDNSDWTNDYQNVDEVTPNDATDLVSSNTSNQTDDHNIESPAMGTNDTINVVQVGVRFNGAGASANASFVLRIKASASGTVEESSAITPSNTTWVTNASAAPRNYSLTLYDLPGASTTAWTKSDLDNAQIGYRLSATSTNAAQISTVWLLVDYTPSPAFPVFDSQSTTNGVTISSLTWAHTCSGTNRLLVVGVQAEDATAADMVVSSITYNSVALTKIRSDVEGAGPANRSELWYLIAPSTGSNNIVVTFAGTVDGATAGAVSFTNALQSGQPHANAGFNQGSNTSITVDVTTTTDNCIVVDSMCSGTTGATISAGARQTENYNALSTAITRGGGSMEEQGGQGTTTMSWTFSTTSTRSAISAAAFAPYVAAGGGGGSTFFDPIFTGSKFFGPRFT